MRVEDDKSRGDWVREKRKAIREFPSHDKCTRGRGIHRVTEEKFVAQEREKKEIREEKKGEERRKKEEKKRRAIGSERETERERKRGEEIERERKEGGRRKRSSPCGSITMEVISVTRRREEREGREGESEKVMRERE